MHVSKTCADPLNLACRADKSRNAGSGEQINTPSINRLKLMRTRLTLPEGKARTVPLLFILFSYDMRFPLTQHRPSRAAGSSALVGVLAMVALYTRAAGASLHPTRDIAGIKVIDTAIVQAAEQFAKAHASHAVYKHVMRSWLYGVLMIDSDDTLRDSIDLEVHAVSSLLHDLGWDKASNSSVVSPDKRFEVDGAMAARGFINGHNEGESWEERRVQLVWDSIALHTERSIAYFKELEVQVVSKGISMDFAGPLFGVPEAHYAAVEREFPKHDLKNEVNETFIWLCESKPSTTYGEFYSSCSLI